MSHDNHDPLDHPEVKIASARGYFIGYAFAAAMMFISLGLVRSHAMSPAGLATTITLIALVAVLAQLYFLFKLDLSESQIWHTVAFAFTVPLFVMAVGLTLWMFHTLAARTMLPGMGM
ncbi:MAG: cytochrome O ubiquinol oxidase [Gammaproteobacteria bacterium]